MNIEWRLYSFQLLPRACAGAHSFFCICERSVAISDLLRSTLTFILSLNEGEEEKKYWRFVTGVGYLVFHAPEGVLLHSRRSCQRKLTDEERSLALTKGEGRVRVVFYYCEETKQSLVRHDETVSTRKGSRSEKIGT